ncbi:precorrin-6y C5,15-methyltransferase (decarboxylating) subunit CbiE [Synechococcus sp. RSCCF101]|nr:precorrin-6y C5,15-methyltransferase (decarboxylating) subunit CbiE [Synechococcus sp. RSCCF101]QEY33416.1 precorrin-6y C5,15-methyltransferase (decarboxylating) subunit CbiE [Synechococcus sp. RSCCF101]
MHVIGCDAGAPGTLPAAAQRLLCRAGVIAAPSRLHPALLAWWRQSPKAVHRRDPELLASNRPEALMADLERWLAAEATENPAVVLASGDPLWFGIGRLLLERFGPDCLAFHPAPSSLQLAFARLRRPWQDASWVSVHGREPEPLAAALQRRPEALAVLPDPAQGGAAAVRSILRASGLEAAYRFWICARLGHPGELVQQIEPGEPLPEALDPLHLVLLLKAPLPEPMELPLFGVDDGQWHQHPDQPGLMTKREVRVQLLADLDLPAAGVLWDLGAGVGSVGLEALRLRPGLRLHAVERRGGGAAVIRANAQRMGVSPAAVLEADALALLEQPAALPDPDRVLLGGGGSDRVRLLERVLERLRPDGVVVVPLATLEAIGPLRALFERQSLQVRISQLQSWRGLPLAGGTRLAPMNPVFILTGVAPKPRQDAVAPEAPPR